jgi:hypothetical protein
MLIRRSELKDVSACVALIEARRRKYEEYQPRFWRKSGDSASLSEKWFAHLFGNDDVTSLVADDQGRIRGFLIATSFPAPPVYDPGGPNALIDDFVVEPGCWTAVGTSLLGEAKKLLRDRGFVQIVVVGARQDVEKTDFLDATDLSLASTWWTACL